MPRSVLVGLGVQDALKSPGAEFEHFPALRSAHVVVGIRSIGSLAPRQRWCGS